MKLKLSLSKTEGIALLTAVPECNRFYHWASGIYITRNADNTVAKIIFHDSKTLKRCTLTPEVLMRGVNLAIQPETELNPTVKESIQSGNFTPDIVLDAIIQISAFGKVLYSPETYYTRK